jgi:hypothetical protein
VTARPLLLALAVVMLTSGCDPGTPATCPDRAPEPRARPADGARARAVSLRRSDLGRRWRVVQARPTIHVLRPDLAGLTETGRSDSPVFVRNGLVARSTTSLFASARDAATALRRAKTNDYADCLGLRLRAPSGRTQRLGNVVRVVLQVPRAAEAGNDPVAVALVSHGRAVVFLELVGHFPAALERDLLAHLRKRLASV